MQALLVLGFAAAFGLFHLLGGERFPKGDGPFDRLPLGLPPKPAGTSLATGASGRRYVVHAWPNQPDGRGFTVAVVKGKPEWLSFWTQPTGQRTMHQSLATAGDLNSLRKDWVV